MRLTDILRLEGAPEYFETYIGLRPVSNLHPPSLKNPTLVHVPRASDGWLPGDSREARDKARQDLFDILDRSRRQIGKPQIAQTAQYPVFPSIDRWL